MHTVLAENPSAFVERGNLIIYRPQYDDTLRHGLGGDGYFPLDQEQVWEDFPSGSLPPKLYLGVCKNPDQPDRYCFRANALGQHQNGSVTELPGWLQTEYAVTREELASMDELYRWHAKDLWGRNTADPEELLCQFAAEAVAVITEAHCQRLNSTMARLVLQTINAGGLMAKRILLDQVYNIKSLN